VETDILISKFDW